MGKVIAFRIVHRSDGWHVLSEDGSKHLGGPYPSEEQAKARLRQVEEHKGASATGSGLHAPAPMGEEKKMRAARAYVFTREHDFTRRVTENGVTRMEVPVGVWDQLAKVGEFEKDGPVSFSEEQLRVALKNFSTRKNKLSMDYDHQALNAELNGQPAPGLARYNAMALVIGGKVVDFATRDATVQTPTLEQVRNPDTNEIADGLYIHRCKVTPLGEKLLPNFEYISPAFTTEGEDEQGKPIGLDFINLAATDIPFLDGMKPIQMTRFGASPPRPTTEKKKMALDPSLMKRLGLDEGYDDGDLSMKLKKAFDDGDAALKKAMDDVDAASKKLKKYEDADSAMTKMDDGDGDADDKKKMDDADAAMKKMDDLDADKDKKSGMKRVGQRIVAMAKELGCAPTMKAIQDAVAALKFTHAPKEEIVGFKARLQAAEDKLAAVEKEKQDAAIKAFAKQAIADGAWDPDDEAGLIEFRTKAAEQAQKHVEKNKGRWTALRRFTRDGSPLDKDGKPMHGERVDLEQDADSDTVGNELVVEARKLMSKDPKKFSNINVAMDEVLRERPELYRGGNRKAARR